jgi:hypothetical protein
MTDRLITASAREQAQIAVELADADDTPAVRALAAAVHRLADVVDYLNDQNEAWARETAKLAGRLHQQLGEPVE